MDVTTEITAANRSYYEAFEAQDLDAMSDVWERSGRVVCTHPGWATLRGWGPVAASFFTLFQGDHQLQFVLTEQQTVVVGDTGWVSLDENLLGDQGGVTVATVNIFVRDTNGARDDARGKKGGWRMVCHHGSVVHTAD